LKSEDEVQSELRLRIAHEGRTILFRNNSGAITDKTGRVVRYGLANDSARVNEVLKSGDLIGWTKVVITPEMVGQTVAIFTSIECKREGWEPDPKDKREEAQRNWAKAVSNAGGIARFISDADSW
jgi:hypothetical protein